jgi:hypothetical protein
MAYTGDKSKDIIIFVHTCAMLYEERAKVLLETWTKGHANVIFITDDPECPHENFFYLGPYRRGFDPIIIRKMFELYLEKYSDYGWFMIMDDDAYLFVDKLRAYLEYFDEKDSYMIGDALNWIPYVNELPEIAFQKKLDYNAWFSGGPGIVFSKSGAEEYLKMIYRSEQHGLVDGLKYGYDLWLAYLFYFASDQKGVKRIHCPGFHQYGDTDIIAKYPRESKLLISIHFNKKMDELKEFHEYG